MERRIRQFVQLPVPEKTNENSFSTDERKSMQLTVGKKRSNSFGELGLKREVVLNGFKGPNSDFGGSKIRTNS